MARSRKSPGSILRFGPLLLALVSCGFVAASAIGYVWHRNRNEALVRENTLSRRQLEMLQKENQELEYRFLGLTRPEALAERARGLGLVRPEPAQVLRVELTAPGEALPGESPAMGLAARQLHP